MTTSYVTVREDFGDVKLRIHPLNKTMAVANLNAEPPLPQERKNQNLAQKSDADAVHHTQIAPEQYIGQGEDNLPRTPKKKSHKKGISRLIVDHNGDTLEPLAGKEISSVVIEEYQDNDGELLTTLRRNDTVELVSGRRAGAGWERSQ